MKNVFSFLPLALPIDKTCIQNEQDGAQLVICVLIPSQITIAFSMELFSHMIISFVTLAKLQLPHYSGIHAYAIHVVQTCHNNLL